MGEDWQHHFEYTGPVLDAFFIIGHYLFFIYSAYSAHRELM